MKTSIITIGLLALASQLAFAAPNFLVILTDDQSWVGTSLLMDPTNTDSKSDYYRTPQIDRLLKSGMRFTDGYASGAWCTPTRRCIQVGQSTPRHIYNRAADENESTYGGLMSIPRALKLVDPDYQCAHFGKWHLKYASVLPKTMGYDVSDGHTDNAHGEMANQQGSTQPATPKYVPDVWKDPKTIFSLTRRTGDFIEAQCLAPVGTGVFLLVR